MSKLLIELEELIYGELFGALLELGEVGEELGWAKGRDVVLEELALVAEAGPSKLEEAVQVNSLGHGFGLKSDHC